MKKKKKKKKKKRRMQINKNNVGRFETRSMKGNIELVQQRISTK